MTTDMSPLRWNERSRVGSTTRDVTTFIWLLPRNVAIATMKAYRLVISPLYGQVCRYYPSCSAYSLESYQRFGLVKGLWLTIRRLGRCHPFTAGGIDDVPARDDHRFTVNQSGFVVPAHRKGLS